MLKLLAPFETTVTLVRRTAGELAATDRTVSSGSLLEVLPGIVDPAAGH
jgi:hypothetical protein